MHLGRVLGLLALLGLPPAAPAHPLLQEYVLHEVRWSRRQDSLEVAVVLTFFERPAMRERVRMDVNRDGRVSASEADAYARNVEATAAKGIQLSLEGRRLPVALLVSPEVCLPGGGDLLGGHHQIRLRYFARLPSDVVDGGARVCLQDGLWPALPALGGRELAPPGGPRMRVFEGPLDGAALGPR